MAKMRTQRSHNGKERAVLEKSHRTKARRSPHSKENAGSTAISETEIFSLAKERLEPATNSKSKEPDIVWTYDDLPRELAKAKQVGPRKISNEDLLSFCHGINSFQHGRLLMDARPFFVELWRRIEKGMLKMSKTEACRQIGCSTQWANAIVSGRADERREQRGEAKEAKTRNPVSGPKLESSSTDLSGDKDDRADERRESEEAEEQAKTVSAAKLATGSVDWSDDEDDRADENREKRQEAKEEAKAGNSVSTSDENAALLTRDEYLHQVLKAAFAILKPVKQRDWQLYRDVCEELSKRFGEPSKTPPVAKAMTAGAS